MGDMEEKGALRLLFIQYIKLILNNKIKTASILCPIKNSRWSQSYREFFTE